MNEETEINSRQRPCQGHTLTQGENSSPTLITLCWEPSRLHWVPFPRRLQWSGRDWCWLLRTKDTGELGIMLDTGSSKDSCDRMWSCPPGPDLSELWQPRLRSHLSAALVITGSSLYKGLPVSPKLGVIFLLYTHLLNLFFPLLIMSRTHIAVHHRREGQMKPLWKAWWKFFKEQSYCQAQWQAYGPSYSGG